MAIRPDDLTPTIPPHDPNPKKPSITLPPLSCDSHFHVFGPHSTFPYAPNRPFTPTDASKEDLFRLHEFLGFQRGVFVQSTAHGSDNRVLVDLLEAGIVDPAKVVRVALENAVSVASVLLLTEATMTEIPEEKGARAAEPDMGM